jgi:hypothetical protein
VRASARPDRAPGHFAAVLILPAAGRWEWAIHPYGEARGTPVVMAPLEVGRAGPLASRTPDLVLWGVLVLVVLLPPVVLKRVRIRDQG